MMTKNQLKKVTKFDSNATFDDVKKGDTIIIWERGVYKSYSTVKVERVTKCFVYAKGIRFDKRHAIQGQIRQGNPPHKSPTEMPQLLLTTNEQAKKIKDFFDKTKQWLG